MKRILAILLLIPFCIRGANVYFDLADFTTVGITNRLVQITPIGTPRADGTHMISSDRLYYYTDTNGTFTASNVVYGNYSCELLGPYARTVFRIYVPLTNGLVDAADIFTGSGNGLLTEDGNNIQVDP